MPQSDKPDYVKPPLNLDQQATGPRHSIPRLGESAAEDFRETQNRNAQATLGANQPERLVEPPTQGPFDYTEWRKTNLFPGMTVEQIHEVAAKEAREGK